MQKPWFRLAGAKDSAYPPNIAFSLRAPLRTRFSLIFGTILEAKTWKSRFWEAIRKNTVFWYPCFWYFVDFLQFWLEIKKEARSKNRWESLQNASKTWPDLVLSSFQDVWWFFIDCWAIFTGFVDDFLMILYHFESLSAGQALQILPPPLSILAFYPSTFSLLACILPFFCFFLKKGPQMQ